MVSGSISPSYSEYFSPFLHSTGSLSVSQEYLALADGPAKFRQGFTCPALLRIPLSITLVTHTGLSPSTVSLSRNFRFLVHKISWSYNPKNAVTSLVWANPRSLATTYGITFVFFSSAYLDVSVQRVCPPIGVLCLQHSGLPHSGICGSIGVCPYPQLFAAYHAFHRLWEPRHPPYALILLIVPITKLIMTAFFCLLLFVLLLIIKNAFYFLLFSYLNMSMNFCPLGPVENNGVEPLTSCVQGRRSSQLS